jgi:hypothetical protein
MASLYASPNIIRVMKQRRPRWADVSCMGGMRNAQKFWFGNRRDHSKGLGIDGR